MSSSYLKSFSSALPSTQGNQILRLLVSQKDTGQIRTLDEFKEKLKTLTSQLLASQVAPTFTLLNAIAGDDISSERYNYMLDRIHDDLEAAFAEADNIDTIIDTHHKLMDQIALKALRLGINELESKVSLYEFLNKDIHGFDDSLFNTFRDAQQTSTPRSSVVSALVYKDPRTGLVLDSSQDAMVDLVGERLLLGPTDNSLTPIARIEWLANANSIRGEVDVSFKNSSLSNLIDGKKNTYWVSSVLLTNVRNQGVPLELLLSLPGKQDINFVQIELATKYPLVLTGIDYLNGSNTRVSLSISPLTLHGDTRINFQQTNTDGLVLKFRQDNYEEVQFTKKPSDSNFTRAVLGQNSVSVDMPLVSDDLKQVLTSEFLLADIFHLSSPTPVQVKYFEYQLGFDNLYAGYSSFDSESIFVSVKKSVSGPGQFGLKTIETRPLQLEGETAAVPTPYTYMASNTDFFHGSIEYWMVTQFFTNGNFLVASDSIPFLPIGVSRIYHERFLLTHTSSLSPSPDMGQLIFYAAPNTTDVKMYRNGTLMTIDEWEFVSSLDPSLVTNETAASGRPMKRGIRILFPSSSDIYTVSYAPLVSTTRIGFDGDVTGKSVDLVGDNGARIVDGNLVVFGSQRNSYPIVSADVYLCILMRRNSSNDSVSPSVEEYMLVTGSKNDQKYVGG